MARKTSWIARLLRAVFIFLIALLTISVVLVLLCKRVNPPFSAFMLNSRATALLSGDDAYVFRHVWVNLNEISPNLALAVVASEDQKFPEHWGFDVQAIEKAYALNQHSHKVLGASTISQQVAKNLFLWSDRSYLRKGLEAYFTVLIESFWTKRRILEIYLNIAEFGQGVYGAEAASEYFFHKSAARLTRHDASLMAAALPNPQRFSVSQPSPYILQRQDWILRQMQALGGPEMLNEIDAYPNRKFR